VEFEGTAPFLTALSCRRFLPALSAGAFERRFFLTALFSAGAFL
jgi:hypothetical protein